MPDIAMCPGGDCPARAECYRHRAVPSDPWQWWSPYDELYRGDPNGCDEYWPIEKGQRLRPMAQSSLQPPSLPASLLES